MTENNETFAERSDGAKNHRHPYHFGQKQYYCLRDLAIAFGESDKSWEDAAAHLKNGRVGEWLEKNEDHDANVKVNEILSEHKKDSDLALLSLIATYNPDIPFSIYGKVIDLNEIHSILKKHGLKDLTDAEKKIVKLIDKGCSLFDYYESYFKISKKTPENDLYSILKNIKSGGIKVSKKLYELIDRAVNRDNYLIPERFKRWSSDTINFIFKNHDLLFKRSEYETLVNERWIPGGVLQKVNAAVTNSSIGVESIENALGILKDFSKHSSSLMTREEFEEIGRIFPNFSGIDNYDEYVSLAKVVKKYISAGNRFDQKYFTEISRKYYIPEDALKTASPQNLIRFIDYMISIEENKNKLTVENFHYIIDNFYIIPEKVYKDINGCCFEDFIKAVEFIGAIISNEAYVKIDEAKLFKDISSEWSIEELSAARYCLIENIPVEIFKKAANKQISTGKILEKIIKIVNDKKAKSARIKFIAKTGTVFLIIAAALTYYLWFGVYSSIPAGNKSIARNFFGYYGIISEGKWIAGPEFEWIGKFDPKNNLAKIGYKKKYGVIDMEGRIVIKPVFQYLGDFNEEKTARMQMNYKFGVIAIDGKILIEAK
ncbi:MAG TPA: WG repeat-containing protein, partial [Candidatus Wallbacteria bacterium]|nr:WG repeat-containing protein [Candidatus Wallbacteria bacterium]